MVLLHKLYPLETFVMFLMIISAFSKCLCRLLLQFLLLLRQQSLYRMA